MVLGPDSGVLEPLPEQQFINQKMRPGSGVLSVQVLPDGPTRVLQVRHPVVIRVRHSLLLKDMVGVACHLKPYEMESVPVFLSHFLI